MNQFKRLRLACKRTQQEVASALCVTPGAVYQWESDMTRPTAGLLLRLATLYGCTVDELLRGGEAEGKEVIENVHT